MDVALVAVQAEIRPDRYRSAEAYRAWILGLAEEAVRDLPDPATTPRLVAFPEMIGLPLPWLLDRPPDPRDASGVRHRALASVWREAAVLGREAVRTRRIGPGLLHAPAAVRAARLHQETFAEAARASRATVVAGTLLGPSVGYEPSRGWHVLHPDPRNRAHVFGPNGGLLGATDKAFLTPGAESRVGLVPGRIEDLRPVLTPVGPVGVAICLDAFHDEVLGRLDGAGCAIAVQPSCNDAPWDRPWPPDPARSEGDAWWAFGLRRGVQDRLHLRYGVNPMLVGEAVGLRPRGRSSIVADVRAMPDAAEEGRPGLVAVAERDDAEACVRAIVPLGYGFGPSGGSRTTRAREEDA